MAALAVALAGCLLACGGPSSSTPDPFPADGFHGAWQRSDDLLVFTGPELYGHIDGGAEVFLELGFDRLEVQRYGSPSGEVAVELYRMRDPAAALGVYLLKCGAEERRPEIPARHSFNRYQVQLVRGATYVSVQAAGGAPAEGDLVAFAREVASRLPGADDLTVLELLPVEGRVEGSERIVRGPFTLQEVMTLGEGDVLQLGGSTTAVAADYGLPDGRDHDPTGGPVPRRGGGARRPRRSAGATGLLPRGGGRRPGSAAAEGPRREVPRGHLQRRPARGGVRPPRTAVTAPWGTESFARASSSRPSSAPPGPGPGLGLGPGPGFPGLGGGAESRSDS